MQRRRTRQWRVVVEPRNMTKNLATIPEICLLSSCPTCLTLSWFWIRIILWIIITGNNWRKGLRSCKKVESERLLLNIWKKTRSWTWRKIFFCCFAATWLLYGGCGGDGDTFHIALSGTTQGMVVQEKDGFMLGLEWGLTSTNIIHDCACNQLKSVWRKEDNLPSFNSRREEI